ncbi:MAG: hypothetical protein IJ282_08435 [Lachnospiraceae bacterium]|nr:hypothetical protein [Lachnospiraceae bacterium]
MNELLTKFNEYKSIVNYRLEYELANGTEIDFKLKQADFPHLIGLHKLKDIPVIRQFNDKNNSTVSARYILSRIKKEELLTESVIRNSIYFSDIEERYMRFCKDNILSLSYSDAIIDFDASKIGSSLQSNYILFEKKDIGYNHLCIAEDSFSRKYAESFFYNPTNLYIHNQNIVKVKKVKIYDDKGNLYMEDEFV